MVPIKHFSDYFYEHVSIGSPATQLQITSACNAKCIFCSNNQNPFDIERLKFRPLEEIEKVLWATPQFQGQISLNESLPGRISEGEAFLHPDFFKILETIRKSHPNTIAITTNGSFFTNEMVRDLSRFNPIKIQVSFPSITPEIWEKVFNLNRGKYELAKNSFRILPQAGIEVFASITPMPNWTGYEDIEKTIAFLSGGGVRFILVYAPGFTKYTKPETVEKLKYNKFELSDFLTKMSKTYGVQFSWSLDPNLPLDVNTHLIESNVMDLYARTKKTKSYWFTSGAAFDRLKGIMKNLFKNHPADPEVEVVPNTSYGGNIECTGLWMIKDLKSVISNLSDEHIFFPGNFLDRYGFDLKGDNMVDYLKTVTNNSIHIL